MSRGRFLAGGAAIVATGAWFSVRPAAAGVPVGSRLAVDIHGHAIGPVLESVLSDRGSRLLDGRTLPAWNADVALRFLDRQGLDVQILSTPDPGLTLVGAGDRAALARDLNDELAGIVAMDPARFGALGVLPLSAGTGSSLRELSHAIDRLGLDGVILPTNVAGRQLADPAFAPVLAELSRRRIPALVHPASPRSQDWPEQQGVAADVLEHAFESVRCAANLLYRGSWLRAPNLRLVFAAGGGGLPFVAGRVAIADQAIHADLFVRPLRRLHFDTAQAMSPGALASTRTFVRSPAQILYGSDWPLVPESSADVQRLRSLPTADRAAVMGGAATALFPTLAARAAGRRSAPAGA